MAGEINISNGYVRDCHTFISMPKGSSLDVSIDEIDIARCHRFLEERDPQSLVQALGLPDSTPPGLIIEAAMHLEKNNGSDVEKASVLRGLPIWDYIERAANSGSVVQGLIALTGSICNTFG